METSFIFTSTTEHLLKSLKKKAENRLEFILPEKNKEGERFFPDGEAYMRIPDVRKLKGKRVVVLHSGAPRPNDGLMELKLALHILKDYKIRPELFFTYFPYGQQDHVFQPGEGNVAESLIKKFLNYYGVRKIYAIDPHFGKMRWVKHYPIVSLSSAQLLLDKVKNDFGQDILFLSPDKGGERRTGIAGFQKKRIDSFNVEFLVPQKSAEGKCVAIIDDLLETGGTLCRCHDSVIGSGAKKAVALITHGVLNSGIRRVRDKYAKLYLTNTINKRGANVDISDLIIETFI